MKSLIYYPSFECTNENWLKFALLYLGKLNPIIPKTGDSQLSPLYRKLSTETDLFDFHRPDYNEGYESSLDAIDIVERIIDHPYRFDLFLSEVNAGRVWQIRQTQTYKIYEEKFSIEWQEFCLANRFGRQTDGGILVPEILGKIYMTVLANTIADKRGVSPITDQSKIDSLSFFLKRKAPVPTEELSNAKSIIELKLPSRLDEISFDEIIRLRNSNSFKKYQSAFHIELENFYKGIEEGCTPEHFVERYSSALNDLSEEILTLSLDTASFSLGSSILLSSPKHTLLEFVNTVTLGGLALVVKSGYSIRRTWRNTESKRHCRRYLANLGRIEYKSRGRKK